MSFNEWKEVKLGDILNFRRGHDLSKKNMEGNKYPVVGSNGIIGFHDEFTRKSPCITIGRSGNVGTPYYYEENCWAHNTTLYIDDFKGNNEKYIYYLLKILDFKRFASGSAVPTLNRNHIHPIEVVVTSNLEEQKAIAKILSDLDKKIEVNNKINKRLEDMAQSIFKHWFVDFEFPNEEGKSYKSSGGEMVESEVGMIPKGWESECIYNLAEYINGTSFKSKDLGDKGLPIIKIAELKNGITDGTKFFNGEKDEKFYLKNRDILFSWSGNPDTSIDTFIWDKGDAILNQHIFKVVPNSNSGYSYVYTLLRSLKSTFTNIARNKQTTGLGHVTVKDLKNLKVALNYEKINEFNKIIEPIINKIINNNNSTINITQLRDTLLPKLMSGEIRVPLKNNK